ncbi:von Willebrand factor type A [Planctopirus limnophila DSM 3776]|uniref:von Willebrand factor type A n=1 Tax=Planctopirus limnophila (strain ATCC 43296 / DSM 3776 / IFAM 1008 / Mu 290) TaxID=521674 RepID=D5SS99_PLAL2|nr:VWA domain-containing protein [Planctopirus limnophila]ADG68823.1 von Willebrand factor type A [Planctopirus limnophila DSM 3776]
MTTPQRAVTEPVIQVSQGAARQSALVGWLLSGCLHLIAIVLLLFVIQGQSVERVGFGNGAEGPPGLVMVDASDGGLTQEAAPSEIGNGNRPLRTAAGSSGTGREVQSTELPADVPPVPLSLPKAGAAGLGSARGNLASEFSPTAGTGNSGTGLTGTGTSGDLRDLIEGTGTRKPGTGLGAATPGTSFMGIKDQGSRVVFVIDCSGSMTNYNAMRVAKTALVSSLQALDTGQQFQIIFYNDSPTFLKGTSRDGKASLWFATEINKTLATQQISAVQPDRGTQHLPALKLALKFSPEVIYFLTDADEPELTSIERKELIRLNQGRSRIHTIEFGQGPELKTENFLKKVARENGGSYRYEDVTRFTSR